MAQRQKNLEIIVVDDGSTDDTVAVARCHGVQVVTQAAAGPSAARNFGIRMATAPIILFTDADCAPRPEWASTMLQAFLDASVAGCKGAYLSSQTELIARFIQLEYRDRYRRMAARRPPIDFIDTYSAGYRRSVLIEVGGFDESFARACVEDQELSFRVSARGHWLIFLPEALVEHLHPATLRRYVMKKFKIGYYKPQIHARFPGRLASDSHTPLNLRAQTLAAILILALAPPCFRNRAARHAALALIGGVALTSWPLTLRNISQDVVAAAATPFLVILRAMALAAGLLAGSIRLLARPRSAQPRIRMESAPSELLPEGLPPEPD
jgi:cellulose synthase/poly-beta-1,6-N-acetylglucosamine synthase-like glycosyltransferase